MAVSRRTFNIAGLIALLVPGFLVSSSTLVLKNGWVLRQDDQRKSQ